MSSETERILCLLERRFPAPEWAAFREISDSTGAGIRRRLDFYALNTWPSKRFRRVAVEVKISRADFRRELARREKRLSAEALANECYFAVPHGLVKVDEVPEGWGLLTADAGGLKLRKNAQWRETDALPMGFIAQLARSGAAAPMDGSQKLWSFVGRDIDRTDLLALAKAEGLRDVYAREKAIRQEGYEAGVEFFQSGWDYRRMSELDEAVREVIGGWQPTAQRFRQWAADASGMPAQLIKSLRDAHTALGTMLELHNAGSKDAVPAPPGECDEPE